MCTLYFSTIILFSHLLYLSLSYIYCSYAEPDNNYDKHTNIFSRLKWLILWSLIYFFVTIYWESESIPEEIFLLSRNIFQIKLPSLTNISGQCSILQPLIKTPFKNKYHHHPFNLNYFDRTLTRQTSSIYSVWQIPHNYFTIVFFFLAITTLVKNVKTAVNVYEITFDQNNNQKCYWTDANLTERTSLRNQ